MKTRDGFVSNSSSSSFFVVFPQKPKTVNDLQRFLFGKSTTYENPYPDIDKIKSFPVSNIVLLVMNSMEWDQKASKDKLQEELSNDIRITLMDITDTDSWRSVSEKNYAKKQLKKFIINLKKHYPNQAWDFLFSRTIAYMKKWRKTVKEIDKKCQKHIAKLMSKIGWQPLPYITTEDLTEKEKIAFEKKRDKNIQDYEELIRSNPQLVSLESKRYRASVKSTLCMSGNIHTNFIKMVASRLVEIFFNEHQKSVIGQMEIYDDTTIGSAMEHGNLFNNLPHLVFSHH